MSELVPMLAAAFGAGLLGSAHCLGMCSGISGLFAVGATVASFKTQVPLAIAYNVGRVLSYAFLGITVAAVGGAAVGAMPGLAGPVRLASGLLIIVVGLQVAFNWRLLAPIERVGAVIWNRLAPHARGLIPATTVLSAAGLGLIWGWLPCGLVYGALLLALTTADPVGGGLVMIAFGLGTMPAMILSGLSAARVAVFVGRNRVAAGLLIAVLGVATMALPLMGMLAEDAHVHATESSHK